MNKKHTSRMRTARLLTMGVSGGVCFQVGCVSSEVCLGDAHRPLRPRGTAPRPRGRRPPHVERQTPVKKLLCPKFRL